MKRFSLTPALLFTLLVISAGNPVHAQSSLSRAFQPDGSIVCTMAEAVMVGRVITGMMGMVPVYLVNTWSIRFLAMTPAAESVKYLL